MIRKMMMLCLLGSFILCGIPACAKVQAKEQNYAEADADRKTQTDIDSILERMTLEEKTASLFMITPEALTGEKTVTKLTDASVFREKPVGGIILFQKNIVTPEQLRALNRSLSEAAVAAGGIPLFIAVDEEGGKVARLAGNDAFGLPKFPAMEVFGAEGDLSKAYAVGDVIGGYLKEYGFHLNFAPDADVITNESNQVIGSRSFGKNPQLVSDMALQVVKGMEKHDVYACLKHFPGHGATLGDTHEGFAYTDKTLEEMMENELLPFRNGIAEGISFIMVAHIAAPNVTGDDIPCSLSEAACTKLLREELGYEGIIITDALNMGAIAENYSADEAAVMAVKAGVDILLMPENYEKAYEGILQAVQTGELTEERINESARRILLAKYK